MGSISVGIDWVALLILGAAYAFSRIKTVSERARLAAFSAAMFAIAAWRLRLGVAGSNLPFMAIAVVLGVMYAIRAVQTPK